MQLQNVVTVQQRAICPLPAASRRSTSAVLALLRSMGHARLQLPERCMGTRSKDGPDNWQPPVDCASNDVSSSALPCNLPSIRVDWCVLGLLHGAGTSRLPHPTRGGPGALGCHSLLSPVVARTAPSRVSTHSDRPTPVERTQPHGG